MYVGIGCYEKCHCRIKSKIVKCRVARKVCKSLNVTDFRFGNINNKTKLSRKYIMDTFPGINKKMFSYKYKFTIIAGNHRRILFFVIFRNTYLQ